MATIIRPGRRIRWSIRLAAVFVGERLHLLVDVEKRARFLRCGSNIFITAVGGNLCERFCL